MTHQEDFHGHIAYIPERKHIVEALQRIRPFVHRTPVLTCSAIDGMLDARVFFKCENFQKVGAFKYRGATNAVQSLPDHLAELGVATHSSGNHAAALSLAAAVRGIPAHIVMPENASASKKAAVHSYGGRITYCAPTLQSREETLAHVLQASGAIAIHPYNDERIISGQATAAIELFEDVADLDIVLTPVGGGGLLSGTALAARYVSPRTSVIAAEPEGADDAKRSFHAGHIIPSVSPNTIADGLLTSLGEKTFAVISRFVSDIVTVDDATIIRAMRLVWQRMKIIIEASAAVPLAMLLDKGIDASGLRIGIIISGGNTDLDKLPWMEHRMDIE